MTQSQSWLLLMHQLSPKADSFRVKIWRSLQKAGALQIKNSVYALPLSAVNKKLFESIVTEINSKNGDAFLCRSNFVKGMSSKELVSKFNQDRSEKYKALGEELREISKLINTKNPSENELMGVEHSIGKVERQLAELKSIDFFNCETGKSVSNLLTSILTKIEHLRINKAGQEIKKAKMALCQGKVWVTRSNIHVDRLASAWLIETFIDKNPRFKFVKDNHYQPKANEVRFDMFNGEFTHIGDKCSFEVLAESFRIKDQTVSIIAEIIHDLDLKDTKFNRPETAGIGMVISSIISSEESDERRLKKGKILFDDLYRAIRPSKKANVISELRV